MKKFKNTTSRYKAKNNFNLKPNTKTNNMTAFEIKKEIESLKAFRKNGYYYYNGKDIIAQINELEYKLKFN